MSGLRIALKEWAVVCRALAEGRQAILLRKGGIAEERGDFTVEHTRFWLFPTYVHQQREGILPEALSLLEQAEAEQPPADVVRLGHFAEVAGIYWLHDIVSALRLTGLHCLSPATVESRFRYRRPGLHVLALRVYRAAQAVELPLTTGYAGCKSWVELEQEVATVGAVPVLGEEAFRDVLSALERLLEPTALA